MNKQEVIKILEKKRETALENSEYYRDKEDEKYEKMNRARVDSYTLAIQLVEQIDEPQPEKVEVPDYVAEWFEDNEEDIEYQIYSASVDSYNRKHLDRYPKGFMDWFEHIPNKPIETLVKMKLYGYTVKPTQWVVKSEKHIALESFLSGTVKPVWTTEEPLWMVFTDRAKAEAVAALVEGTVEEVAE